MPFHLSRTSFPAALRNPLLIAAILCGVADPSFVLAQNSAAPEQRGPQIAGCEVFPADNVWNTPIDKLPLDPRSKDYVATIGPDLPLHPDFGADSTNGIPITIIDSKVKYIKVTFGYKDDSDLGNYPVPPDALIEGGPHASADNDRHILLVDKDRCMLMELYSVERKSDDFWTAGSGIKMDLTSNALREEGKTSADAAGLPILPGLVRYDEVAAGEIRHALRFTVPKTQRAYIWPARHFASSNTNPKFPPMGARFRLRADFDISSYSKPNQVILTALKRYGMFLADNGSAWFVTGAPDSRWNDDDLHKLLGVKGSDFEAVNESDWQYIPDSARVDPMSTK
jgi:hypothetical protein